MKFLGRAVPYCPLKCIAGPALKLSEKLGAFLTSKSDEGRPRIVQARAVVVDQQGPTAPVLRSRSVPTPTKVDSMKHLVFSQVLVRPEQ